MRTKDEILQKCLEDIESGASSLDESLLRHPGLSSELRPLLEAARRYRCAPLVQPSAAFRDNARARMLNLIAASPKRPSRTERKPSRVHFPWSHPRIAGVLARISVATLAFLVIAGGSAALVSAAAPDSPLYPARLALEEARLMLARSSAERLELRLDMAERRATELLAMAIRGTPEDLHRVENQYEQALRLALRELTGPNTTQSALLAFEALLADEERALREALATAESAGPEYRASLGQALGEVERLRAEVRQRLEESGPTPPADSTGSPEPQQRRQQEPPPTGVSATDTPTATLSPAPDPEAGGAAARYGDPTPVDAMQQRQGQRGDPTSVGYPYPTATPVPNEPAVTPGLTPSPAGTLADDSGPGSLSATPVSGQYGSPQPTAAGAGPSEETTPEPDRRPPPNADSPQPATPPGGPSPSSTPSGSPVEQSPPPTPGGPGSRR